MEWKMRRLKIDAHRIINRLMSRNSFPPWMTFIVIFGS